MNIISNDGSNKLNRSRKARVSYKVQRTINASLNAATSTRAVSSNPNFVTRQKIEIIFEIGRAVQQECPRPISYAVFCLKKKKRDYYKRALPGYHVHKAFAAQLSDLYIRDAYLDRTLLIIPQHTYCSP